MTIQADGLSPEQRRHQVWKGLRLVAVDTETTGSGANIRIVSVAAITVRNQMVTGSWGALVNPLVKISAYSTTKHGITDNHVAGEPEFHELAGQLLDTLRGAPGETVVFVAHKAGFDLGALRAELDRSADADGVVPDVPDLPVLDTLTSQFHDVAGFRPAGKDLSSVAAQLGLTNVAAHNATGDALACAQIAIVLINRAIDAGYSTFAELHAAAGGLRTSTVESSTNLPPPPRVAVLSEAHASSHLRRLPAEPDESAWEQWRADVAACALSRCPRLTDRLQAGPFTTEHLRRLLGLTKALARPDPAGNVASGVLNTVAHALGGNIARVLDLDEDDARQRQLARQILLRWAEVLDTAGPCSRSSPCPSCAVEEPCSHDLWWRPLVPALRGPFPVLPKLRPAAAKSRTKAAPKTRKVAGVTPAEAARTAHRTALRHVDRWFRPDLPAGFLVGLAADHPAVGNYAIWSVIEWHLAAGRTEQADDLAAVAVNYLYLDPRTVNHHLTRLTSARRAGDIATALTLCTTALASRGDSTDAGWLLITSRQAHLAGLAERLNVAYTGQVDANGNPIPKRRHHPENPRRIRTLRFARDPHQDAPASPGPWVRINDAARQLRTTTTAVAQLAEAGTLASTTVNGLLWVDEASLTSYREQPQRPATPKQAARQAKHRPLPKQTRRPKPPKKTAGRPANPTRKRPTSD